MEVNPLSSGKRLDSTHSMETFDTTTIIIRLLVIALLIILTAFFVAAEFSVVKMRMSRIDQLITEGSKTAKVAKRLLENLDYYLSACQLGITVTALGLGWLGESTVGAILSMLFEEIDIPNSVSTIISFVL
ncbi:MAG TPA: transporter associated domain protein, partial [Exiguobacterium sp.]|nr:transporter associated domain protein [Exiguobacterium sp.]